MKVAVYKDCLSTGRGADRAVRSLAAGLAARGYDVSPLERDEFFKCVLRAADGCSPDVIIATGSNEIVDLDAGGYFDRSARAKVILQLHLAPHGFFKWRHPLRNCRIRRAFDKPDAVQVLCSSYAQEFTRMAPHPPVTVIGNYTDMAVPDSGVARLSDENAPTVLYPAAAMNRIKNQKLLIESFATLAADFPEWRVRLLGRADTAYAEECRRLIAEKGLSGRIDVTGFTDDLAAEYSRAAFIAFPSRLEGFPLALLEAAKFSLPAVVLCDLPGVEDIVTADTGIVTKASVREYAAGLRAMMSDAVLRRSLGESARLRCENLYSKEKILDAWEALLQSVVK